MAAARERSDARLAIKLEKEVEMETGAKEHKEASLRQQERRSEKNKAVRQVALDTEKCDQGWADLEHSAEEAGKASKAADIPALVAQAVRKARAELDHMVTALAKSAAEAAAEGGSTAIAQAPMEVDAAELKRPLDEVGTLRMAQQCWPAVFCRTG